MIFTFLANLSRAALLFCSENHLPYEGVSERCELSSRYFGDIARGKTAPTIRTLEKLCSGMESTPNELLLPAETDKRFSYRQPMAVFHGCCLQKTGRMVWKPICPRCGAGMEPRGQNFCDNCGQRLDWSAFCPAYQPKAGE